MTLKHRRKFTREFKLQVLAELHRQGVKVNHKRVLRLMREDNLLCLRKRKFISTTDSSHLFGVIRYIRLLREFVYLAVILDAFSRRVIGWDLEPYLEMELAVRALRMALVNREVKAGLIHHSDRGVQYASSA